MLSEAEANVVMEWVASGNTPKALLNHLTELHRLRDHDIYNAVAFSFMEDGEVEAFKHHQEMYDA